MKNIIKTLLLLFVFTGILTACGLFTKENTTTTTTKEETTTTTTTEEETTTTTAEQENTRIYFYNSEGYEAVSAYIWGDCGELLGGWPGTEATQDGTTNWWYIDVPVDTEETPVNIIFNNGDQLQAGGSYINDTTNVYVTVEADSKFASKELAEASLEEPVEESTKIYFYNSGKWANVKAYVYGPGELFGGWPGTAATKEESSDWWYVDVPVDTSETHINIIFNNGGGSQSGDAYIDDTTNVYVTVNADGKFASKELAEASIVETDTKIYFYNSDEWTTVYAYIHGDAGEVFGGWPGTEATQEGETNWWYVEVPVDTQATSINIIFNNNDSKQSGGAYINDNIKVYVTIEADGKYASKELAEAAVSEESTKIYFYNSEEWTTVKAYIHGDAGEVFGGWPGTAATQEGETNWWYIEVPLDTATVPINVIFNGDGAQSGGAYINDTANVYVTTAADGKYTAKVYAENAVAGTTTKIYFYNSEEWTDIKAHVYNESGNMFGSWPGKPAVREGETNWWYIEVPVDTASTPVSVIFNGNGGQSGGVFINDAVNLYVTVEADSKFASKTDAENSLQ